MPTSTPKTPRKTAPKTPGTTRKSPSRKPRTPKTAPATTPAAKTKTVDVKAETVKDDYAPIQPRRSQQQSAITTSVQPLGPNQVRVEACLDIQQLVIGLLSHFFPG